MSLITDLENIANTSSFALDITAATKLLQLKRKWDRGEYNGNHMQAMEDIGTAWRAYCRELSSAPSPNKTFWDNFHMLGYSNVKFHYLCLEQPPPA